MTIGERYLDFGGMKVHCIEGGSGFPVMVMHGVGPGTTVEGNFLPILGRLIERYYVLGVNLIGFGRSQRKESPPFFDFPLWFEQMQFALDTIDAPEIGLLGHSLGGALALKLAARNPRVTRVLTTGCTGKSFPVNKYLDALWTFPETREQLREAMACALYDRSGLTDAFIDDRLAKLHQPGYKAYYDQLFSRKDHQAMIDSWALADEELRRIPAEVVMMHGRDDLPIPYAHTTAKIAPLIQRADVWLLARCGHSVAIEYPSKVLAAARQLFG